MSGSNKGESGWNHPWVLILMGALFGAIFGQLVPQGWNWLSHLSDPSPDELALTKETAIVTGLRPGGRAADLSALIGQPPSEEVDVGKYHRSVFVLRDSAVLAVSDQTGRVLLVSVTSFNPHYRPTFDLPDGTKVRLWDTHIGDVQEGPQDAVGFVGARRMYYYEWTWGPTTASGNRQELIGWSDVVADTGDETYEAFEPFYDLKVEMQLPPRIGEAESDLPTDWMSRWIDNPASTTLRRRLVVNTIGYQAVGYEPLPVYPAPDEGEVWPHLHRDGTSGPFHG